MAKSTSIISLKQLTVEEKRFNVDFCHEGGEGYRIYITPYVTNTDPDHYSSTALMLTGAGACPGMACARLLKCSRPSKANTATQRPIAIAKIATMVSDMLRAYGQEVDDAIVLAQVEQAVEAAVELTPQRRIPMQIPIEYLEAGFEAFRQGISKKYPLVPSPAIELAAFTLTSIALNGNKDADSAKHLMLSLEAMNTPDED